MAQRKAAQKHAYLNRTQGWLGAITINRKGDEISGPVPSGDIVYLTDEERDLTAQSHRQLSSSPFETHHIVIRDTNTGEITEEWDGPLLERQRQPAAV